MHIRFLLGPAGSGKTFRCLQEIREALRASPEGAPLILLAPKQATFQLERQLLSDASLPGYTRLHILSFERLARFIFQQLQKPEPQLLQEEGRVMVLRALLERKRDELQVFRATARLPGFARQLSQFLRELQQHHVTAQKLDQLAMEVGTAQRLSGKLHDIGIMAQAYADWLREHQLQDADNLLDLAAAELKRLELSSREFPVAGLWLDGFAQMTPQERQLLAAIVQRSDRSTLAFCLDAEPKETPPWHSIWAPVTEAFLTCRDELSVLPGARPVTEILTRDSTRSRFRAGSPLAHLEKHWTAPRSFSEPASTCATSTNQRLPVRLIACPHPELEIEFAAREIRRHVRETGGRFRDTAVLLRNLDGYHDAIHRVFTRYEIPFFLDRRESVAHHPLAELTRHALRLAAFGWEHEDWFAALKTGLICEDDGGIDWLENEALSRGWRGAVFWTRPISLPKAPESMVHRLESLRQVTTPSFERFCAALAAADHRISGATFTRAIRDLWSHLKVDRQLQRWSESAATARLPNPQMHQTVWDQMLAWLENLERAFHGEHFTLHEWLPIVEAGLGNLTVGVIPPALDQMLVGAVDRSRNPDLQLAFVLGMNEGVFPAPPANPTLLNRAERETLADHHAPLGSGFFAQIGMERYYGYIACTRARSKLIVTYAERDTSGRELNPSVFVSDLRRLFPALVPESFQGLTALAEAEHWSEAAALLLRSGRPAAELLALNPAMAEAAGKWNELLRNGSEFSLPPELVEQIHGPELSTSVSALEDFAACPFRFFIGHGLRAAERVEFEIDSREKGSFQHEILEAFHRRLTEQGKRWRDLTPFEARRMIRQIGESLLPEFKDGLFTAAQARRFTGLMLIDGLERLVETLIAWTAHYRFDPAVVEIEFGLNQPHLPGWRIDLDGNHALVLRGRIDRVDLCRIEDTGETLAVVIDYKSSARELDRVLLDHGLQLQLLAYLGALEQIQATGRLAAEKLIPAGAFYVALNGGGGSARTRREERNERDETRRLWSRHRGRFDGGHLPLFDARGVPKGEQFEFKINKDGSFAARGNEALPTGEFQALVRKVEEFLRQHGSEIYAGKASIAPFRYRGQTACDFCDYRPICRFDPWTQPFRILRPVAQ